MSCRVLSIQVANEFESRFARRDTFLAAVLDHGVLTGSHELELGLVEGHKMGVTYTSTLCRDSCEEIIVRTLSKCVNLKDTRKL